MTTVRSEDLPHYRWEDYRQWEGDWELIGGIPYAMTPAPVKRHQRLVGQLFVALDEALADCPDCEVLLDEDWKVASDTVVRPDLAVVCRDPHPDYISRTPELVIEVISPATALRDEGLKFRLYEAEGVAWYVLVYPEERRARIFRWVEGRLRKAADCGDESFAFDGLSCPLRLDFARVFARLD